MLKAAQCLNCRGQALAVAYVVFNDRFCVFTAVESANEVGSSINYAEDIVQAIAEAEERMVGSLRYFDLQTRASYAPAFGTKPQPGDFEFDEVKLEWKRGQLCAVSWSPTHCPENIADLFKDFIDGVPHQCLRHKAQEVSF